MKEKAADPLGDEPPFLLRLRHCCEEGAGSGSRYRTQQPLFVEKGPFEICNGHQRTYLLILGGFCSEMG
ncbi:hypothetical protein J2X61_006084 [Bacillus sp. 3255]|nr:hypothetical protein [Bacillus sp. 3255]